MSRCLLHKTKLESFKSWMTETGIEHRPGRGDFQILQIKTKNGQWQCIFDRIEAPEHYTVAWPLEPIVRRFIRANKESKP
ncbi:hypothetical protein [Burkholderia singularis]|uniref:hypothetical protein n=1 Tax=Burkholderia singularis TaxID=1503053 RepID=UPI00117E02CA|nr:hypothetical protein [Burkholderia singularis]